MNATAQLVEVPTSLDEPMSTSKLSTKKQPKKRKKAFAGRSFGLKPDLSIPAFDGLPAQVKIDALEIFSLAVNGNQGPAYDEDRIAEALDFCNENEELLALLPDSEARIRYHGIEQLTIELYEGAGQEYHRQQQWRLRDKIKKVIGEDLPLRGFWSAKQAIMHIGSTGCSITGRRQSIRPYLPLVGSMLLIKYSEILVAKPDEDRSDDEIADAAYDEYGYFERADEAA